MSEESKTEKLQLPEYAVDMLVKSELHRTATYDAESRERLEYIKQDFELRTQTARNYRFMLTLHVIQTVVLLVAFVLWVLK